MSTSGSEELSLQECKQLADHAGLGMSQEELEQLKPLYELYARQARLIHSVDLKAEEMGVMFRPDWEAL